MKQLSRAAPVRVKTEVRAQIQRITVLTLVLAVRVSSEQTAKTLLCVARIRVKMEVFVPILWISARTPVLALQVSPESTVKLNTIVTLKVVFVQVGFRGLTTV